MTGNMRIVCVGGGPAGLYFAISAKLRRRGHDSTVIERNPAGVGHSARTQSIRGRAAR